MNNKEFIEKAFLKYITSMHEVKRTRFQPNQIVCNIPGISRYEVNKHIKSLKENEYIKYITIGGGCDEWGEPVPPYNCYKFTEKGLEYIKCLKGPSSEQWILDGDCSICRRLSYCTKKCKARVQN